MVNKKPKERSEAKWQTQTRMVHGGGLRSGFGETSEAIFPTSGYVYDSAEQAEARFKGEDGGYTYSRFENPTVSMFERRMCLLEDAKEARATASGMAAVSAALLSFLSSGDHIVAAKRFWFLSLCCGNPLSAIWHHLHARRRRRY